MKPLAGPWRALAECVVAEYRTALGDDLVAVAVFGSVARGTAGPASDLDLYVVTRPQEPLALDSRLSERWRVCETPEYLRLAGEGYRPDPRPVFHTVEQLKSHPWILLDIADHGVVLYDPERVLETELEAVRARLRALGSKRIERPDGTWYWDLKPDWRPGQIIEL
jgi:predicted nucleotidyltransferase